MIIMIRIFSFLFLLGTACISVCEAQTGKTKEEKTPVFNYVVGDDPMDHFKAQPDTGMVYYDYLVPEFYFHKPRKVLDTTYEFFCYDARDVEMPVVYNYDSVFYYSLYKSYTDSAHKYTDSNGVKQFLPVSSIAKRYDKVGREKWMTIEYPGNKYGELHALRNVIVSTDTEKVFNTHGDNIYQKVYHYYRLLK